VVAKIPHLFEDPTSQIEDLTQVIKQDMHHLTLQLRTLKEIAPIQSFQAQQNDHAKCVVAYLNGRVARLRKELGDTIEIWTKVHKLRDMKMKDDRSGASFLPLAPVPPALRSTN
jgi:hypothetical protein